MLVLCSRREAGYNENAPAVGNPISAAVARVPA